MSAADGWTTQRGMRDYAVRTPPRAARNGLTLQRHRVVLFDLDRFPFEALVEEIETGIPIAECYRVDVAERIARALEAAREPKAGGA